MINATSWITEDIFGHFYNMTGYEYNLFSVFFLIKLYL